MEVTEPTNSASSSGTIVASDHAQEAGSSSGAGSSSDHSKLILRKTHEKFVTLLIETPPVPKPNRPRIEGTTGRWKCRSWTIPRDISVRTLENFLRHRLELPESLVLLLDGRRIQPECTVAQIDGLCAGQRPLGRTPKLLLEHQRPRRNGLGIGEWNGNGPLTVGPLHTMDPGEKLHPLACKHRCGFYGAGWWRGLCSACYLQEAAKGEISEEGYDGDRGEGDDAPTIVEGALVATPPKPARTASGAAPIDPHRIHRAAALWSGGLPGELVRVVIQFLAEPPSTEEQKKEGRAALVGVNPARLTILSCLSLLQLNHQWAADVAASGPHVLSLPLREGWLSVQQSRGLLRAACDAFRFTNICLRGARRGQLDAVLVKTAPALTGLSLEGCKLPHLDVLQGCAPTLTSLRVVRCPDLVRLSGMRLCTHLTSIEITSCGHLHDLSEVSYCEKLENLTLSGFGHQCDLGTLGGPMAGMASEQPDLTAAERAAIHNTFRKQNRPPLKLWLRWCRGLDLSLLTRCLSLEVLEVTDCCCLTGFVLLINCPRLKELRWGKSALIEHHDSVCADGLRLLAHQIKQTLAPIRIEPEVSDDDRDDDVDSDAPEVEADGNDGNASGLDEDGNADEQGENNPVGNPPGNGLVEPAVPAPIELAAQPALPALALEQLEQIAAHNGVPLPQLDAGGNAVQGVQAFLQDVGVAMQNQVQNAAVAVPILAQAAQQAVNLAQGAVALAQQQNSEEETQLQHVAVQIQQAAVQVQQAVGQVQHALESAHQSHANAQQMLQDAQQVLGHIGAAALPLHQQMAAQEQQPPQQPALPPPGPGEIFPSVN